MLMLDNTSLAELVQHHPRHIVNQWPFLQTLNREYQQHCQNTNGQNRLDGRSAVPGMRALLGLPNEEDTTLSFLRWYLWWIELYGDEPPENLWEPRTRCVEKLSLQILDRYFQSVRIGNYLPHYREQHRDPVPNLRLILASRMI